MTECVWRSLIDIPRDGRVIAVLYKATDGELMIDGFRYSTGNRWVEIDHSDYSDDADLERRFVGWFPLPLFPGIGPRDGRDITCLTERNNCWRSPFDVPKDGRLVALLLESNGFQSIIGLRFLEVDYIVHGDKKTVCGWVCADGSVHCTEDESTNAIVGWCPLPMIDGWGGTEDE